MSALRSVFCLSLIIVCTAACRDGSAPRLGETGTPSIAPTKANMESPTADRTFIATEVTRIAATAPTPAPSATVVPLDAPATTEVPLEERQVLRRVTTGLENSLPADELWILQDNLIIANNAAHSTFELQKLLRDDASDLGPVFVQVSSDGSRVSYVVFDTLVIDHLIENTRNEYQYREPEGGYVYLTAPLFSPDNASLVFGVVLGRGQIWGVKRIDLATGEEEILPLTDDVYKSSLATSGSGKAQLAARMKLGGERRYAFFPSAWTESGIYGRWVLPGTDAGLSRGWLMDPETLEMRRVLTEGGFLLPTVEGEVIAYTTGEAAEHGYTSNPASVLKVVKVREAQTSVLLADDQRLLRPLTWSPDKTWLAYTAQSSPSEWPFKAFGVIDLGTLESQDIDLRSQTPSVSLWGLSWLDSERIVFLLREEGEKRAVLYELNVNQFTIDRMKKIGEFTLPSDEVNVWLLYVPSITD